MQSGLWDAKTRATAEIVIPLDLICSKAALRSILDLAAFYCIVEAYFPAVIFKKHCAHARTDNLTLDPSV